MTKVQLHCDLVRPLTPEDLARISDVHGYYGIMSVTPAENKLAVYYDATRLTPKDVENVLIRYQLPIQRAAHN